MAVLHCVHSHGRADHRHIGPPEARQRRNGRELARVHNIALVVAHADVHLERPHLLSRHHTQRFKVHRGAVLDAALQHASGLRVLRRLATCLVIRRRDWGEVHRKRLSRGRGDRGYIKGASEIVERNESEIMQTKRVQANNSRTNNPSVGLSGLGSFNSALTDANTRVLPT